MQPPRSTTSKGSVIHHVSRPNPCPVQPELILADVNGLETDEDGVVPKFKYGIAAAVGAQAHLLRKAEAVGSLLTGHGVDIASWVAQAAFRVAGMIVALGFLSTCARK